MASTGRARRHNGITGELQDEQRLSLFMGTIPPSLYPFPFILAQLLCHSVRLSSLSLSLLSLLFLAHPVPRRVFASLLRFRTNRDQLALLAPISALDILLSCPPLRAPHRERAQIPLFPRLSGRRSRFSTMI